MAYEPNIKDESSVQREAFKYYYEDGENRSYAKVAVKFQKSLSTIEKWGKSFKWQERVEDLSKEKQKRAEQNAIVEHELDYVQRNLKIVRRGILEHAKAIQNQELKLSYKSLMELMELEKRLREGVDGKFEVRHKFDLSGLTNDQIQQRIDERLQKLERFRQVVSFDKLKDPLTIDADYSEEKND